MNRIVNRCRDNARRNRTRMEPRLESLEDRRLLATYTGGHWYNPIRITYSFVPDGTSVGGVPSTLFQAMNGVASQAVWQQAFQRAAAIWQQVANFNIVQVTDNGDAVGGAGYQQGDPRFGDIRIAGTPMSSGYLGYTILPPPINGGTDAGDIVINTTSPWRIGSDYDLQTVAIHEFGHALGLGHSAIAQADMYATYTGMKQALNADDIAGIQYLYGAVPADPTNNTTSATAIDLTSLIDSHNQVSMGWGYVTNVNDLEWYKVTVPATTTGTMVVKMQTSDLSSLCPRMAIYVENASHQLVSLGQAIQVNLYGATVSMTFSVTPGQVYYIRDSAANVGPGSNGAFGIQVNFGNEYQAPIPPPNTVVYEQADQGVNGWVGESMPSNEHPHKSTPGGGQGHGHKNQDAIAAAPGADDDGDDVVVKLGGHRSVGHALTIGRVHPRRLPAQKKPA